MFQNTFLSPSEADNVLSANFHTLETTPQSLDALSCVTVSTDDWRKIQDPAERRRSQNRYNQRMRRTSGKARRRLSHSTASITPTATTTQTTDLQSTQPLVESLSTPISLPDIPQTPIDIGWCATGGDLPRIASKDSSYGKTPLHHAVWQENMPMVRLLLEYGSSVAAQDSDGKTPMHLAVLRHSKTILRKLLEGGSTSQDGLNLMDDQGKTPLHYAVSGNDPEIVKILLDAGANVNAVEGFSPSMPEWSL